MRRKQAETQQNKGESITIYQPHTALDLHGSKNIIKNDLLILACTNHKDFSWDNLFDRNFINYIVHVYNHGWWHTEITYVLVLVVR